MDFLEAWEVINLPSNTLSPAALGFQMSFTNTALFCLCGVVPTCSLKSVGGGVGRCGAPVVTFAGRETHNPTHHFLYRMHQFSVALISFFTIFAGDFRDEIKNSFRCVTVPSVLPHNNWNVAQRESRNPSFGPQINKILCDHLLNSIGVYKNW